MATKYPYQSKWAKANRDIMNKSNREWRKRNPKYHYNYLKIWAENNKDKVKQYATKFRKSPKGKISQKITEYKKRARLKNNGTFSLKEWEGTKLKFNFKCVFCQISEEELLNKTGEGLTIDHIIPLSKGGTNYILNIQPLCRKCNLKKWNKIM